jgi:DNA-directed RNA polymerase-3 subunit RPC5
MKPNVGQVEISVPLEVEEGSRQSRFSLEKAKTHGKGVKDSDLGSGSNTARKSRDRRGDEDDEERVLSRMTLRGEVVPDQTNYCVALLKDGQAHLSLSLSSYTLLMLNSVCVSDEIHLVPVTETLQIRPHLGYLDQLQVLEKQARAREKAGEDESGEESAEEGGQDNVEGEKKPKRQSKKVKQEEGAGPKQV